MNSIKTYINSLGRGVRTALLALAVIFVSAGLAQAATTISTNISTGGTLAVTGVSTMSNSSTTQSATIGGPLWVGGNATTTAAGALSLNGALVGTSGAFSTTLGVTGVTSMTNASTSQSVTIAGPLWVGGNSTTTAAGALTLTGPVTVTNPSATSTITVGCVVTTATSTATPVKILFSTTNASSTINGATVQGFVVWAYGSNCTN